MTLKVRGQNTSGCPKVSIVIPVYNGSNYVAEAIDSALAQTYPNIEVVVVNDGSNDAGQTDAICKRYGSRISYITQENRGVAGALNAGIAHMSGEIFTWLSHDDLFLPEKTAQQVEYYNDLGREDAILFSNFFLMDATGAVWHETQLPCEDYIRAPMLPLLSGAINGCTLFIPVQILRDFGPFDEQLRYVQDYALWNKILKKLDFFFQPKTLIKYRVHPGQDTHKPLAIVEGNSLWKDLVYDRTEIERVQLFGSTKRYYSAMADFLEKTPYKEAAADVRSRADQVWRTSLVTVVIPFYNEIESTLRAARSVLSQSYAHIELILVDDGSTDDIKLITHLAETDNRVLLIRQANAGPGSARNRGMEAASGEYIALLDADDVFLPHKVQLQLSAMQDAGTLVSHTSYYVSFPGVFDGMATMRAGLFTGTVFPQIIADCPIATPTVMLHRSLIAGGIQFPTETRLGEDVLTWVAVAQEHSVLGLDMPLTIVEWSHTSAAVRVDKAVSALTFMVRHFSHDPLLSRNVKEIGRLKATLSNLTQYYEAVPTGQEVPSNSRFLLQPVIDAAFGTGATDKVAAAVPRPIRKKILLVCFPYSVHAAHWASLLPRSDFDVHVFPSVIANELHVGFQNLTFWDVPGIPTTGRASVTLGLMGSDEPSPITDRDQLATRLAKVINQERFDCVHTMEFQHAGYVFLDARGMLGNLTTKWIATNYGADIAYFGSQPEHAAKIREILEYCDFYWSECARDVALAREFGFKGPSLPVVPNSGGIDLEHIFRVSPKTKTSDRKVIAVKGYQHFAGRALVALQALEICRSQLKGYRVVVYSPFPEVRVEAERLAVDCGIDITCLAEWVSHDEVLALHGSARVSIAVSVADGISTSLLEAMAMGSFPIQSSSSCAAEWIEDGKAGFIVDAGDPEGIAAGLARALCDDELVDIAAAANWGTIERRADRRSVAEAVRAAYAEVLNQ